MNPEQENELVARWMGWEWIGGGIQLWHHDAPHDGTYRDSPPPYRTDPVLLWELIERLLKSEWSFEPSRSGCWSAFVNTDELGAGHYSNTLAQAVFAAAVMQAEQEGT